MDAIHFEALTTFESEETHSAYVEGLPYVAHGHDATLRELIPAWALGGRIRVVDPSHGPARVGGLGTIQ